MSIAGALKATLEQQRVVAVVTIERATDALPLADALCGGGGHSKVLMAKGKMADG